MNYDYISDKEKADRDLDFNLSLLSEISKKDESIPGKNFVIGKAIIESNRMIRHREKEYI